MVVQLVPEGLLIGADRNVTTQARSGRVVRIGQSRRPKVLKWPNRELLIGYVGLAAVMEEPIDQWLYRFIGRHLDEDLGTVASALKQELEAETLLYGEPLIIHLGGFARVDGDWRPVVWFIRNTHRLNIQTGAYEDIRADFAVSEEISSPTYFGELSVEEIRANIRQRAEQWQPFWFHQGYDLGTFNALDQMVRIGMRVVVEGHPMQRHPFPTSLDEWAKHLRMAICTYGSYFDAFYEPFEQFVGGGADVVWASWPRTEADRNT